ncbi:hypothetical protein YC2023_061132 [Brassica napus]
MSSLRFPNCKVPMVTPIETKQESVRSDLRRGSYENGVKAAWSLDGFVGPTRPFDELDGLAGPTLLFGKLDDGCFAFRDPLSEASRNLSRRLYFLNPFRNVTKIDLVLPLLYSFEFFFKEDISREVSDFDFVVTGFDPNS